MLGVIKEQKQELLEVGLGQQLEPHVQAGSAEQFNQAQEVPMDVGPWLGQSTQCQDLERRKNTGAGAAFLGDRSGQQGMALGPRGHAREVLRKISSKAWSPGPPGVFGWQAQAWRG